MELSYQQMFLFAGIVFARIIRETVHLEVYDSNTCFIFCVVLARLGVKEIADTSVICHDCSSVLRFKGSGFNSECRLTGFGKMEICKISCLPDCTTLVYKVRNTMLSLKSPVFDTWHLNTTEIILEYQPPIDFVNALVFHWREVAILRTCAKCVQVLHIIRGNRYSVVGVETGLRVRMSGVRIQARPKCHTACGTQTASNLMITTVLSCGKSQRYDTGHTNANSCDVRNKWIYTSFPTLRHQGVGRDSFSVFVNKVYIRRLNNNILTFLIEIK
jgi:hypothetical protein